MAVELQRRFCVPPQASGKPADYLKNRVSISARRPARGTDGAYRSYRNYHLPRSMNKLFASLLLALAAQVAATAAPVDLGTDAGFTPYDAYMRPVRQVLGGLEGEKASMDRVRSLMREGRNFRYAFTQPYVASLPEVTETKRKGDCKDKALWLANRMGDENVRFVVGKARRTSKMSHAWLLWENEGRWWILDCTNNYRPIAVDTVSRNEYIPLYSWAKEGVYRHSATQIMTAASGIAGKASAPVASR